MICLEYRRHGVVLVMTQTARSYIHNVSARLAAVGTTRCAVHCRERELCRQMHQLLSISAQLRRRVVEQCDAINLPQFQLLA